MILICYDGSPDAKAAIDRAAKLLPNESATVLTVWEPFIDVLAHTPGALSGAVGAIDYDKVDETSRSFAEQRAAEGAEYARAGGLTAEPRAASYETTIAKGILGEADDVAADAIVMGSRGLTGVKSLLLGSVSHAVIQHADRPVIVVPSPEVAERRSHELRDEKS
jgi:nucleotide-binding universal stress UspA family protein